MPHCTAPVTVQVSQCTIGEYFRICDAASTLDNICQCVQKVAFATAGRQEAIPSAAKHYTTIIQMQKRTLAYVACLAVALLLCPVSSELIMAYSVQRHGARNVLPKSAVLTENDAAGGPTLLPAGQQMCYEAGKVWCTVVLTVWHCDKHFLQSGLHSTGKALWARQCSLEWHSKLCCGG